MKVLIIEDHDDFRETLRKHLEAEDIFSKIFEASSGELGVMKAMRERPDVILMDIRLPQMNGIDAAGHIKKILPGCKIIVLSMFETKSFREIFESEDIEYYIGKSELFEKLIPILKKLKK
jgi:two-component system response regulator DegU